MPTTEHSLTPDSNPPDIRVSLRPAPPAAACNLFSFPSAAATPPPALAAAAANSFFYLANVSAYYKTAQFLIS